MTRYLLTTWEGGGCVPPELGLARRLIARGHQVRVLACPAVEPAARAAGCEFSPWVTAPHKHSLAPEEDIMRDWEFKNIFKLFAHVLDVFLCGPADKFAADTLAVLDKHPADVVLNDMLMLGAQMAAEKAKLPSAILVPNISMRPAKGVPAIGPGFLPATGPLGRLRDALLNKVGTRIWAKGLPALNRARGGLGLDPLRDIWAQYDRADRVLVMTSPTFDFVPPQPPANTVWVGPVLDDPSWAGSSWEPPWPATNADPIVLVGLSSTYQHQQDAIRNAIAALAKLPVRALVTIGPALAAENIASPAPHVVVVKTAPHSQVLAKASLAITHCGHGTTIRALAAGVPLVCIPMGRDQNDTAARVVARGAGVRLTPTAPEPKIRKAVERVLAGPHYAAAARALADAIRREVGELDPIGILERLAHPVARPAPVLDQLIA
jgi:MGT family glycosyltransferase